MESNWAAGQLQIIRTLMERSALYRRALAPVMLLAGLVGVITALAGFFFHIDSGLSFCGLWLGAAVICVVGTLLIARRQAFKDREAFWSPPTRRVALALFPPLAVGLYLGLLITVMGDESSLTVTPIWILFYGCALHSAGFFMPRGVRFFGWLFILAACCFLGALALSLISEELNANWIMGFFFGVLHLGFGAYLYLTEKGKNAA